MVGVPVGFDDHGRTGETKVHSADAVSDPERLLSNRAREPDRVQQLGDPCLKLALGGRRATKVLLEEGPEESDASTMGRSRRGHLQPIDGRPPPSPLDRQQSSSA